MSPRCTASHSASMLVDSVRTPFLNAVGMCACISQRPEPASPGITTPAPPDSVLGSYEPSHQTSIGPGLDIAKCGFPPRRPLPPNQILGSPFPRTIFRSSGATYSRRDALRGGASGERLLGTAKASTVTANCSVINSSMAMALCAWRPRRRGVLRACTSLEDGLLPPGAPESRGSPVDLQMVHLCGRCRVPGAMLVPARDRAFYPVCSFLVESCQMATNLPRPSYWSGRRLPQQDHSRFARAYHR